MGACDVLFQLGEETDATPIATLANAWIYWREAGTFKVLRLDASGQALSLGSDGDPTRPDGYTTTFTATDGSAVEVFYTKSAAPLSEALVANSLVSRTIAVRPGLVRLAPVHAPTGATAAVRNSPVAELRLPPNVPRLTSHMDQPALLFLQWEAIPLNDPYYTEGIPQHDAWFARQSDENQPADEAPEAVRRRLRGITIAGEVPSASTGVRVKVVDNNDAVVKLLRDGSNWAGAQVEHLDITPGAASGDNKPFSADLFFPPDVSLGRVQLLVEARGLTTPLVAASTVYLLGVQVTVVDDFEGGADGANAGPELARGNEVFSVDYSTSPATGATKAAAKQALTNAARARRLVRHAIRNDAAASVALDAVAALAASGASPALAAMPAGTATIRGTQMPLWMVEMQVLGLAQVSLEDYLQRRALNGLDAELELAPSLKARIHWHSSDHDDSGFLQPELEQSDAPTVKLTLATDPIVKRRLLVGSNADGTMTGAFVVAPSALTYPTTARRTPSVRLGSGSTGVSRNWGWHAPSATDALVVEWQPSFQSRDSSGNAVALIRGGNLELELTSLSINGASVSRGVAFARPVPGEAPAPANPTPASGPVAMLPTVRVYGQAMSQPDVRTVVDVLVEEFFRRNGPRRAWIRILPLGVWQDTMQRIIGHESGHRQYSNARDSGRYSVGTKCHGKQRDMPKFGYPHGYGIAQLDPPGTTPDQAASRVWDTVENLRRAIDLLMNDKGGVAYRTLRLNNAGATLVDRRMRATFHRQVVRAYNGGTEFTFDTTLNQWVIAPATPVDRREYPNDVLSTAVDYSLLETQPHIEFVEAAFGPGI